MQQAGASGIHTAVSGSGQVRLPGQREQFLAEELAIVMSHYDIGVLDSVVEFARGSRKAPKLLIISEQGKFLLKRRARGKDDPFRVAFAHAVQLYLASRQFPLPHLVGTRRENNSMLQWRNNVYELFEFIPGQAYPQTLEATYDAGRVLGLYHKLLQDFRSEFQPPTGSYHLAPSIEQGLKAITATLEGRPELSGMMQFLADAYASAGQAVEQAGIADWPRQIVHGDWHPGNMLFRDSHVVAVIDYDAARLQPPVFDIANGVLQFSILGGDDDVSRWPDYLDESRFKRFVRGYDSVVLLSQAEVRVLPHLMIEALIAEAVLPIAATGNFGRVEGLSFLQMVRRKVLWLQQHTGHLVELAED